MERRLVILTENTTPVPGLSGEYGFSAAVLWEGSWWLFDTGLGKALFDNARFLGVDIGSCQGVILSHGHFDHVGGLLPLVEARGGIPVFLHPDAVKAKKVKAGDKFLPVGFPVAAEVLKTKGAEFRMTPEPTEIAPGLVVTGAIPRSSGYENTGGDFFVEEGDGHVPDLLLDDQALIMDTAEGLVVLSGCAHSGMVNMLEYAHSIFPSRALKVFIGGTHLITATRERLDRTVEDLKRMGLQRLVVSHCTGFAASCFLSAALGGERVAQGHAGYMQILA